MQCCSSGQANTNIFVANEMLRCAQGRPQQTFVFTANGNAQMSPRTQDPVNTLLVKNLMQIVEDPRWEQISTEDDVFISKLTLSPEFEVAGKQIGDEVCCIFRSCALRYLIFYLTAFSWQAKFAVIMAQSVLEAPPEQVCRV